MRSGLMKAEERNLQSQDFESDRLRAVEKIVLIDGWRNSQLHSLTRVLSAYGVVATVIPVKLRNSTPDSGLGAWLFPSSDTRIGGLMPHVVSKHSARA